MKPRRAGLPAQRMCDLVLEVGRFWSEEPNRCGIVDRCRLALLRESARSGLHLPEPGFCPDRMEMPCLSCGTKKIVFLEDCDWMRTGTYFGVIPRSTDLV